MKTNLTLLREQMQSLNIDFYYVPSSDAHQNEYTPACWCRRAFISGFNGSAGDVIIGVDSAKLWTDGRYAIAAKDAIDSRFFDLEITADIPGSIASWLTANAKDKVLGVDPAVVSINQIDKIQKALESVGGKLKLIETNLIDRVWEDKPVISDKPLFIWDEQYAGESLQEKLKKVRNAMTDKGVRTHVISHLDAIMWLLNIRGNDFECHPFIISYLIVSHDEVKLFTDLAKIDDKCQAYFADNNIQLFAYEDFGKELSVIEGKAWVDPAKASLWIKEKISNNELLLEISIIDLLKLVKNNIELANMATAHVRDGLYMTKFLYWLENNWQGESEYSLSQKIVKIRQKDQSYWGKSFSPIVGYGKNGAIVHYAADQKNSSMIDDKSLLLMDSGAQYFDATTDITRTIHLGEPTAEQKRHYTLVLKGHLALRHMIFPHGTSGEYIDVMARSYMWQYYINYSHGTGHGVGCFMGVHEGPIAISPRPINVPLTPGMVLSNEPGAYFENEYGIRIENLVVVKEITQNSPSGHGPFYGFSDLTLVPYCTKLIDKALLNEQEKTWICEYHQKVYNALADKLTNDEKIWLKNLVVLRM